MAILGLTRTLAFEVGGGIRVNTICPGPTKGPRIESVIQNQADLRDITYDEAKEVMFLEEMALGDLGEADDVANMVAFLASEMGDHITAQDINIDGGGAWY
jgi:NAD(P)-dependent dehydrogenase (short-subunit alcohol dehydrogenase family)